MKARIINLMRLLVETNEILTIKEIASKLEVSNKTIRNDLSICEPYLKDLNVSLVKKSGVGVFIQADEKVRLEALNKIKRQTVGLMGYGSIQRQLYILKKLLFGKVKISFSWLEMNLYVSKPSIYKDIHEVEDWLRERDISLCKDNLGRYVMDAGEKRIRKAIFDWRTRCIKTLNKADQDEMIGDTYLDRDYGYKRAKQVARKIEEVFKIRFVPEDFNGLIIKLSIIIERMQDGHYVTLSRDTLKRLTHLRLYGDIDMISEYIKSNYHIRLTESEKGYLLGLIVSMNIYEGANDWNVDEDNVDLCLEITDHILHLIQSEIKVLVDRPEVMKRRVLSHIQTLVNQINYGLYSYHSIAENINNNYKTLCHIVDQFKPIFKEKLSYDLTLSDTCDFMILLAEFIEESKRPLDGIFLYSHKYADAKLSIETLKNNFKQVVIHKAIPVDAYKYDKIKAYDIVFIDESYDEILVNHKKAIVLPPLLSFADKITLFDRICHYYEEKNFYLIKITED
ncbi:PRD domain-containing protein [Acidaminobacter sp. JC074]|uniref:BglG family transcription antiterminator n=1 Tax=Acidaminobacter sp. JC074 TaxID=2530199 RepID=UPI001F0F54A1|nr:helix-turn-helix domain-containing protein [Acidaminobacter sp. JC074]MCH4886346.1 PRD domain-containing protein [Acidaminobacter sp. JC074]